MSEQYKSISLRIFDFIKQFILLFILGVVIILLTEQILLYNQYGTFTTDIELLKLFFDEILETHKTLIMYLIITMILSGMLYIQYMQHARNEKVDCELKRTTIEDLAQFWLDEKRYAELMQKVHGANEYSTTNNVNVKKEYSVTVVKRERTAKFYEKYITPLYDIFNDAERDYIKKLIEVLETEAIKVPSVNSKCQDDSEYRTFSSDKQLGELTSYNILTNFSLYDHTLRVTELLIESIKRVDNHIPEREFGRAIIGALAHDLGKIFINEGLKTGLSDKDFKTEPHYVLGIRIISELIGDYVHLSDVIKCVGHHHNPRKDDPKFVYLLEEADKGAREIELNLYKKRYTEEQKTKMQKETALDKKEQDTNKPTDLKNTTIDKIAALMHSNNKISNEDDKPEQLSPNNDERQDNSRDTYITDSNDFMVGPIRDIQKKGNDNQEVPKKEETDIKIELDEFVKYVADYVNDAENYVQSKQPAWLLFKNMIALRSTTFNKLINEYHKGYTEKERLLIEKEYIRALAQEDYVKNIDLSKRYLNTNLLIKYPKSKEERYICILIDMEKFKIDKSHVSEIIQRKAIFTDIIVSFMRKK